MSVAASRRRRPVEKSGTLKRYTFRKMKLRITLILVVSYLLSWIVNFGVLL